MEINSLTKLSLPPYQGIRAVSHYQKYLIAFCPGSQYPYHNTFKFYQIQQSEGKPVLSVDRQVTAKARGHYYASVSKLFTFHCYDLNKPIMVLIRDSGSWNVEVYDFDTGELLAHYNAPRQSSDGLKLHFSLWKQHFLIDDALRILRLVPNNKKNERYPYPYEVEFTEGITTKDGTTARIFNLGDQLLLRFQYSAVITNAWSAEDMKRTFYAWDAEKSSFVESAVKFNTDNLASALQKRTEGHILNAFCIKNKIITVTRPSMTFPERLFLWKMSGKAEMEICLGTGSYFVWNNLFVEIEHVDDDQEDEGADPTIHFWNAQGQKVKSIQKYLGQFYVWDRYLVLLDVTDTYTSFEVLQMTFWEIEKLIWLAFVKNKGTSPLARLPKEILKLVIEMVRENPAPQQEVGSHTKRKKSQGTTKGKRSKKK